MKFCVNVALLALSILVVHGANAQYPTEPKAREMILARARSLELDTQYVPPPGDPLTHHTSGFAKIMCSAVFVTGLDPDFAAENVGYFTSPYSERARVSKPVIDYENKAVHVTLPSGLTRTAKYVGDQGCVTMPVGLDSPSFTPQKIERRLPDPSTQSWPMGDRLSNDPCRLRSTSACFGKR